MKICFDFDGVILDTERYLKYYADYYSYFELGGKTRKRSDTLTQEKSFNWSTEETEYFYKKYYIKASKTAPFVPGAKEILKKLKSEGHELYIVSGRYNHYFDEIQLALDRLKTLGIEFSGYFWNDYNKGQTADKIGAEIMVEDNPKHVASFEGKKCKCLFFKDVKIGDYTAENVKKIDTWMDIYLEVQKLMKQSKNHQ